MWSIKKTFYEVGKLRELDRQRKEELRKRIEAEAALQGVDKSRLYKIIEENI